MTIAPTAARGRRADARHVVAMQLVRALCMLVWPCSHDRVGDSVTREELVFAGGGGGTEVH